MSEKVAPVKSKFNLPRRESGFTLVEMMVGMLIGLIAIVVMFQVFAVSEGQKRTTAGAGEAQQNGVTSLYLIQRDGRMAGYGLGFLPLLGCQTTFYYIPTSSMYQFRLVPILITDGAGGTAPDQLTILYSSTDTFQMPSALSLQTAPLAGAGPAGQLKVGDQLGYFNDGDLAVIGAAPPGLAANPLANPPLPTPGGCTMIQVTHQVPLGSTGDFGTAVYYNDFAYVDQISGASRAAEYNPPSAVMPAPNNFGYPVWKESEKQGGRVTNLGHEPTLNQYYLANNQLMVRNLLRPNETPVVIADGVVQFQAQYGYSSLCPDYGTTYGQPAWNPLPVGQVPAGYQPACRISATAPSVSALTPVWPPAANRDVWADSVVLTGVGAMTPMNWRQIVALRFVVVARSINKEKPDPSTGVCNATTVQPVWSVNSRTLDVATTEPDWMCYRYRTYEGVVPVRNMIWSPDPQGSSVPPA
jgi:type IV pilus assembly protein PilW